MNKQTSKREEKSIQTIEGFSIEYRESKTKINYNSQSEDRNRLLRAIENSKEKQQNSKAGENTGNQVLIGLSLHLIG